MALLGRFGGIVGALVLVVALFVLGFATAQTGLLFMGLLCAWPLLWAITAWTVRGLRDNYQLVPKAPTVPMPQSAPARRERRVIPQEEF